MVPVQLQQTSTLVKDALAMVGEILLFFLLFFTVLGILNYYNIVQLAKTFSFLSALPHRQQRAQYIITTLPTPSATRAAVVTTVPYSPADEAKDKALLQSFISAVTPSNALPASPSAISTSPQGSMHVFFTQWQHGQDLYQAAFATGYQGNPLMRRKVLLTIKPDLHRLDTPTITMEHAKQLLSVLLVVPTQEGFSCGHLTITKMQINVCQTETITATGRRFFGIFGPVGYVTVFACEIPRDSPYYFENNPCIVDN